MTTVKVNASQSYNCIVGQGILADIGKLAAEAVGISRAVVVSDIRVYPIYGDAVVSSLTSAGFDTSFFVFGGGEEEKTLDSISDMLEFFTQVELARGDVVVALGGGIVGDTAGFAASVYMRGIRYIGIPTTVLAALDSSVGGKTAVNLAAGKNLCGSFHQPSLVVCDTDTFSTLSPEIYSDGIAEAIKYGVICDKELFDMLGGNYNIDDVVCRCIRHKSEIVHRDEFESGERKLLNFGHTAGHAIEKLSGFEISHGHAVALGMMRIAEAAERNGMCAQGLTLTLKNNLIKNSLPVDCPFDVKSICEAAKNDKKRDKNKITLVLPEKIGHCVLQTINSDELEKYL